jgi:hypothetical protein
MQILGVLGSRQVTLPPSVKLAILVGPQPMKARLLQSRARAQKGS